MAAAINTRTISTSRRRRWSVCPTRWLAAGSTSRKTSVSNARSRSDSRRCAPLDRRRLPILTEIDVDDLCFGDEHFLVGIVVAIRLDNDPHRDGCVADALRLAPEADQIADEDRLMKHDLFHGTADHDP